MGLQNGQKPLNHTVFAEAFGFLAVTVLSLTIPLSFFALAKFSSYNYLVRVTPQIQQPASSLLFSFVLYANPAILYVLVSTVSVAALVRGLTGKAFQIRDAAGAIYRPCFYAAWIMLCVLQFCALTGIEGIIRFGINDYNFENERSLLSGIVFFLGLHETVVQWCRMVVKPLVDDAVFGVSRDETWAQKVAMALVLGTFWWRLREEVESLAVVGFAKIELVMPVGSSDLVGWWLYYLTVLIGTVRIIKGLMRFVMLIICRRECRVPGEPDDDDEPKV